MRTSLIALAALSACQATQETPAIPLLHGLSNVVGSTVASDEIGEQIATARGVDDSDVECLPVAYQGIAITGDVGPSAGKETVMVSLARGLVVLDAEGVSITDLPGYHCDGGSIDELEGVAIGDAYGAPTIAIAATTGGHHDSSTWISLFRLEDGRLDPVFTATVEQRSGDKVIRGAVYLIPNGLLYRHPLGAPTLYLYNSIVRAYLVPGDPIDDWHDDGPSEAPAEETLSLR